MSAPYDARWKPGREDRRALMLVVLLPLLLALPGLVGLLKADPMLYLGALGLDVQPGLVRGSPYIDPNSGYSTQALGYLSAWMWLKGMVPWWNHYVGIGLPLAAEYQAGSFFPLSFLLMLPRGMAWQQVALQILAGLGTYGLLRQMGMGRLAATSGALLYAFNGTLAWFAHASAAPVPFLPWFLWGIERIAIHARNAQTGGWGMFTFAMAMSLLASFPETAYLSGLLGLGWAIVRGFQLPAAARFAFAKGIVAGGLTGIAIAAPQVYSFLDYLRHADIGEHGERFAHEAMNVMSIPQSLVAPYFLGPIFSYVDGKHEFLFHLWGPIGGYVTLALLSVAFAGFWIRRDAIGWLLFLWCVAALLRTFGFPGISHLWNLIPGVSLAAIYRYICPSWEMAMVLLAMRALDGLAKGEIDARKARTAALAMTCVAFGVAAWIGATKLWPLIADVRGLRNWAVGSMAIAATLAIAAAAYIHRGTRGARALAILLVGEAMLMSWIPMLGNPRGGQIDMQAVQFLRDHLGLQRFYTLGPFQPNYGAYFRLASVNYNVLPNSKKWHLWVQNQLDQKADSVVFNGLRGGPDSQAEMLKRHRRMYEEVGTRFVLTNPNSNPFAPGDPVKLVYQDPIMDIYELLGAKQYFDSVGAHCTFSATHRDTVLADCSEPDRVVRRELFYPGWSATLGGAPVAIEEHLDLFQSVKVPAGKSEIRFSYAPHHIGWAWLAALAGLLVSIGVPLVRRARR